MMSIKEINYQPLKLVRASKAKKRRLNRVIASLQSIIDKNDSKLHD